MGHAEFRTSEFSRSTAADQARAAQVATLFPPKALVAADDTRDTDPKSRRIAALVFLGGTVAFWGGAAAVVSAYWF